jgi:dipeptidyl aminopeptidase/acylaminoacyl peptidase
MVQSKWFGSPAAVAIVFVATGLACQLGVVHAHAQAKQFTLPPASTGPTLQITDLYHLRTVSGVDISPDGVHVIYSVSRSDSPGPPHANAMVMDLTTKQSKALIGGQTGAGRGGGGGGAARWSPDGKWVAYEGTVDGKTGLCVSELTTGESTFLAPMEGTNAPLPGTGNHITWSPDSKQIAYISAMPGPEPSANGDPHVITRYLYKPTASEGVNPYNDNKRLHIFVVDVATKTVRQLTSSDRYEHSIQWSPKGDVILFESNMQPNPDQDFNYDILTVKVSDGSVIRLTHSVGPKYAPVWSPDGERIAFTHTVRPITSMETTGEDTHLWVMNADGSAPHILPQQLDLRYGTPQWSADGAWIFSTVQDHGQVRLIKTPLSGGAPTTVIAGDGSVTSIAVAKDGTVVYAYATPTSPANLYMLTQGQGAPMQVTDVDKELLGGKKIAPVRRVEFKSFDLTPVEAFLTEPADLGSSPAAQSVPMIVNIHGGPHGEQGPEFNPTAQIYAGHGFATLMVNYRGSTGYGQKFEDKIMSDQDGGEGKDVLAAVDAALAQYKWIDPNRLGIEGGSYGGQLADWLISQTTRFKAAVPTAGISNLVSTNYLSYYHDYLPSEYKGYFNTPERKDLLWERSAIRYADRVKTPVLFLHGANDNDVPTEQAEEYFIALKDAGVETVMVLYPREGHGLREVGHQIDGMNRSMAWYDEHFRAH